MPKKYKKPLVIRTRRLLNAVTAYFLMKSSFYETNDGYCPTEKSGEYQHIQDEVISAGKAEGKSVGIVPGVIILFTKEKTGYLHLDRSNKLSPFKITDSLFGKE